MTILIDMAVKATVVLAAAWLASLLLSRRAAASRHILWCAALAALAALPVLTAALPSLEMPLPGPLAAVAGPVYSATVFDDAQAANAAAGPAAGAALPRPPARRTLRWTEWPPIVWAAGAAAMLVHLLTGYALTGWLRRKSRPVTDGAWRAALADAAATLGVTREVRLLEHPKAGVPMAMGILRPAICLPPAAREWTGERRRMVLLHETGHILRQDALTHLAARFALCLYWFHPLAWLAAREALRERERACDDLVLAAGERPSEYAGHLLEVATTLDSPAAAWGAAAMARRSQLEGRLVAILDNGQHRGAAGPLFAGAAALAVVLLIAPLAAMRPAPETVPPATAAEMDALIRAAVSARDHAMLERTAAALAARFKFEEAQQLSKKALEVRAGQFGESSREYAEGLLAQGKLQRAAGQFDLAAETYSRALAIEPGNAASIGYLALAAQHKKQYGKAVELYLQALARETDPQARGRLLTGLAACRQELGDAAAEQDFQAAVQSLDPQTGDHATALELYSRFLTAKGRGDEAQPLAARAKAIRAANVLRGATPGTAAMEEKPLRIGGGVTPPKLIAKSEPKYSEIARVSRYQGSVKLFIVVGSDGMVRHVELKEGLGMGLDEQAAEAVRQWRFEPGMKDGRPVSVAAVVEVNFRLL